MPDHSETKSEPCSAALLTPRGRGAVATIRVHGESLSLVTAINACFNAANKKPWEQQPVNRIVYGLWGDANSEDLVLCRLDHKTVDIHCHGGLAAIDRILQDLQTQECVIRSSQEIARNTEHMLEVELQETVTAATTFRAAEILLRQSHGLLRAAFESLLPDTNTSFLPEQYQSRIQNLLHWESLGLHLTSPWRVVLAGRPNVGKSSLINALLGYDRSIVFDEAGTTRDVLTANTAIEGWPFQFSDTAGLREQAAPLEAEGIQRAEQVLNEADCRVILIDTSQSMHPDDQRLLSQWSDSVVIAHKVDLPQCWNATLPERALFVSSKTNAGIDALLNHLVKRLVPEVPDEKTAIPVTRRQIELLYQAAEALREADHQKYDTLIRQLLFED
ncbi:MAG: 50S ribosome-binding GTPase [Planctomycetes bacterium]|nr:50S ribosome-binding GTPase [Planctomycetota bacterium]MCH9725880.1 50S ribosome-binding GTPase [Planctomycetota bacterium]MCH9777033.1 50S ribosome-binding GTPase [Planctomycetota bacterium]MCH9789668.1 50S ribosome-binding GTPase [Planctomycetota bacterium]